MARRGRGAKPAGTRELLPRLVGERQLLVAICRLASDNGLLHLDGGGDGAAKKDLPTMGSGNLIEGGKRVSPGVPSTPSVWLCLFRLKILRMTVFRVLPVRRCVMGACDDWIGGSAVSNGFTSSENAGEGDAECSPGGESDGNLVL